MGPYKFQRLNSWSPAVNYVDQQLYVEREADQPNATYYNLTEWEQWQEQRNAAEANAEANAQAQADEDGDLDMENAEELADGEVLNSDDDL